MSRGRKIVLAVVSLLALLFAVGWFRWYLPTRAAVDIGAAMLSKQMCSCLYVANRDLDDCRADQFSSMDPIQLEWLRDEQRVRAFVPAFGERTSLHREGFGCMLE
jgi:hypothetical protein